MYRGVGRVLDSKPTRDGQVPRTTPRGPWKGKAKEWCCQSAVKSWNHGTRSTGLISPQGTHPKVNNVERERGKITYQTHPFPLPSVVLLVTSLTNSASKLSRALARILFMVSRVFAAGIITSCKSTAHRRLSHGWGHYNYKTWLLHGLRQVCSSID